MEISKLKEHRDLYDRYMELKENKEVIEDGYVALIKLNYGDGGNYNIYPDTFENTDIRKVLLEAINGEIEITDQIIENL
jgi:hypothetical protein